MAEEKTVKNESLFPVIRAGGTVTLKKPHPCGSADFRIMRAGSDVRIMCLGCGRVTTLPREKLERAIKTLSPVCAENKDKGSQ